MINLLAMLSAFAVVISTVAPASVGAGRPAIADIDGPTAFDELHLVFPQDAALTRFDSTFGHARSGGRRHQGADLMAPKMSPVYAVADGVVLRLRVSSSRAGATVRIDHGGGWESWYMHLNNDRPGTDDGRAPLDQTFAPGLEVGDFVAAGQLIGYVGDSGNAEWTGPHTHFELHRDGRPVDPYAYLLAAHERAMTVWELERLESVLDLVD